MKTWWDGEGPMPDDERELLVSIAMNATPSLTREQALKAIAVLENFDGVQDLERLAVMHKPAADA